MALGPGDNKSVPIDEHVVVGSPIGLQSRMRICEPLMRMTKEVTEANLRYRYFDSLCCLG